MWEKEKRVVIRYAIQKSIKYKSWGSDQIDFREKRSFRFKGRHWITMKWLPPRRYNSPESVYTKQQRSKNTKKKLTEVKRKVNEFTILFGHINKLLYVTDRTTILITENI